MDGLSPNNEAFKSICSRLSVYAFRLEEMALCTEQRLDFHLKCVKCFRSAVQLLDEGHISEDEYKYIIGLAFSIEDATVTTTINKILNQERKEENYYET